MNRREFLSFRKDDKSTADLSCEQLYMRYLDSTLDGTTSELFKSIEDTLSGVTVLRLSDAPWLSCDELTPIKSILARFQQRGGRVEIASALETQRHRDTKAQRKHGE